MSEILVAVDTKEKYKKYKSMVLDHAVDKEVVNIVKSLKDFYNTSPEEKVDWKKYIEWYRVKYPVTKPDTLKYMEALIERAEKSSSLGEDILATFVKRYHAGVVATTALKIAEGKSNDFLKIEDAVADYHQESGKLNTITTAMVREDLSGLLTSVVTTGGLKWRLGCLNQSLGEIRKGNFIMFAGRVETGKSTMLVSEATYMAQQLPDEKKVIFFVNEESGRQYKLRVVQSTLGVELEKLKKDPVLYWSEYQLKLGNEDKIIVVEKPDLSIKDIEDWLDKEDVGLICIDQLRKVRGYEELGGVQRTEKLFQHTRELAKQYCPIITVGQLSGEAEGVQFPTLDMLYESKTAAQAELDAMVMIGSLHNSVPANARYLNVVKNKLPSPLDLSKRNGKHEVKLVTDIARYID